MATTLSKSRALLILVIGVVLTWPGQMTLAAIGSTELFRDETATVVLSTYGWLAYTVVALGLGLVIACGVCVLLTRSVDPAVRTPVRTRYIISLAVIVVLSALAAVEQVDVDAGGHVVMTGITPLMLLVWVVGSIAAIRVTTQASATPVPATSLDAAA